MLGVIGLALLTFVAFRLEALPGEAGLVYSFFIVLFALWAGFIPSILISIVAMLCFDYFFTPPIFSFDITLSERRDPVALVTFLGSAFIVSRLMTGIRERNAALEKTNEQCAGGNSRTQDVRTRRFGRAKQSFGNLST